MVKYRLQRTDTDDPPVCGIGFTRRELLSLLAGKELMVHGCHISGIPEMVIVSGDTNEEIEAKLNNSLEGAIAEAA